MERIALNVELAIDDDAIIERQTHIARSMHVFPRARMSFILVQSNICDHRPKKQMVYQIKE